MSLLSRRNCLGLATLAPLVAASEAWAQSPYPWKEESPRDTLRRTAFPNVTLKAHNGKTVNFYDDLIKDKFVTLNFMYINCGDGTCPVTTYNLMMIQQMLKHRVGKDMFMYSITIDPKRDSLEMLRNYADVHGVKPGWLSCVLNPRTLKSCGATSVFTTGTLQGTPTRPTMRAWSASATNPGSSGERPAGSHRPGQWPARSLPPTGRDHAPGARQAVP